MPKQFKETKNHCRLSLNHARADNCHINDTRLALAHIKSAVTNVTSLVAAIRLAMANT